jgi:hypothetical protein
MQEWEHKEARTEARTYDTSQHTALAFPGRWLRKVALKAIVVWLRGCKACSLWIGRPSRNNKGKIIVEQKARSEV